MFVFASDRNEKKKKEYVNRILFRTENRNEKSFLFENSSDENDIQFLYIFSCTRVELAQG